MDWTKLINEKDVLPCVEDRFITVQFPIQIRVLILRLVSVNRNNFPDEHEVVCNSYICNATYHVNRQVFGCRR
jgi:hypothetical protein